MRGGPRQSSREPAMMLRASLKPSRASQRLPAPPAAAAALPSAEFCCLPTEDAPAAPGPAAPAGTDPPCRDRGGDRGRDLSPVPQARLLCVPAQLRNCFFRPILPCSRRAAAVPAAVQGVWGRFIPGAEPTALKQPGPEWGLLLPCFPPGQGSGIRQHHAGDPLSPPEQCQAICWPAPAPRLPSLWQIPRCALYASGGPGLAPRL